ncbi:MAG: sigma 54-interacting transcriptional regulator [Polyangiaceae bacterium]
MSPVDQTLDEVARAEGASVASVPVLFVVLEGDRPLARGARFSLVGIEAVSLGRGPSRLATRSADGRALDVRLPGRWISTNHVVIRAVGGQWIAEDAGSRNGMFVNGERVTSHVLREGDILEAGRVYFIVRGAPTHDAPLVRDIDAESSREAFGLLTLLPELAETHASLSRIARSGSVPVLLLGPTGSGKEVLAREVHTQSNRQGPFVAVNCGALPAALVESLLFGHVKGAFSGAARDEIGFVRSAEGGTLFLDEIGDLPPASQAALLRVLQEHEVIPVGATRATKVDVRVIAATHRPLETLSGGGGGAFRSDLLARLRGYTHRLPPLCERAADLGVILADILVQVAGDRATRLTLTPEAARALLRYSWPLNIRELRQAMASAVALAVEDVIDLKHLPAELSAPPIPAAGESPDASPDDVLRDRLIALLHENRGNVTAVARAMGKAPAQIHRWMRRFVIDPDAFRST